MADGDDEATASLLSAGANVNHLSKQYDWASPTILAAQEGSLDPNPSPSPSPNPYPNPDQHPIPNQALQPQLEPEPQP